MPWNRIELKLKIVRSHTIFIKKGSRTTYRTNLSSSSSRLSKKYSLVVHLRFKMKDLHIVTNIIIRVFQSQFASIFKSGRYIGFYLSSAAQILALLIYLLFHNNDSIW